MNYSFEIVGNFFIRLHSALLDQALVLYDGRYWWVGSPTQDKQPCIACFQARYACWRLGKVLAGEYSATSSLEQMRELAALQAAGIGAFLLQQPNESEQVWQCIDLVQNRVICAVDVISLARCAVCTIVPTIDFDVEHASNSDKYRALRAYVQNAFGLVAQQTTFEHGGLAADFLSDYLSTILTVVPKGAAYVPLLCSARDTVRERAEERVLAEFVERYAYAEQEAVTSSGFAAHWEQEKATEHAMLELFERDACMRWWCNPLEVEALSPAIVQQACIEPLLTLLQDEHGSRPHLRLLRVPSQCDVPVVVAFVTVLGAAHGPYLIVGSGAAFTYAQAADKALNELSLGLYNYLAGGVQQPPERVCTPNDHGRFYYAQSPQNELPFLHALVHIPVTNVAPVHGPVTIDELVARMHTEGMLWTVKDVTPRIFAQFGMHVVQCTIPTLLPICFGTLVSIDPKNVDSASVALRLPHPFF